MKIVWKTAMAIAVLCLCGCAGFKEAFDGAFQGAQNKVDYGSKAKEHEFSYFFPKQSFDRTFATPEEAYDYIKTAQAKFSQTAAKPRNKGLTGKLIGTSPKPGSAKQPVIVCCFLGAATTDKEIDLTNTPMEQAIRNAITAIDVYMVFYQDRQIVMPSFYLKEGYTYTSANTQFQEFWYNKLTYKPEYPFGWNAEKAFSYLRKEID